MHIPDDGGIAEPQPGTLDACQSYGQRLAQRALLKAD